PHRRGLRANVAATHTHCFARVYAEEPLLADCWPKDLTSLSDNCSLEYTGNVSCGYHRNGQCGNHVSRIWLGPERPRGSQDLPSCHARHSRPRGARSRHGPPPQPTLPAVRHAILELFALLPPQR